MIVKNSSAYGFLIADQRRRRTYGDFWTDAAGVVGGIVGGVLGTNRNQPQTFPQYPPPPPPPPPADYTTPALIVGGTVLGGIVLYKLLG